MWIRTAYHSNGDAQIESKLKLFKNQKTPVILDTQELQELTLA